MKKNQHLTLKITDLSYQAMGVAHYQGLTIFVNNALPGEIVQAKILKVKKKYAFAKCEHWQKLSPYRVQVKLNQWVQTGLASLSHLRYDQQLLFKQKQVKALLEKAHLSNVKVQPTLPSPEQRGYRNKAEVPIRSWHGKLEIGFFRRHSHDLVPLTNFFTTDPAIDRILLAVRHFLRVDHIVPYDEHRNQGEVRYLDIRHSKATGKLMVILVCRHKHFRQLKKLTVQISQLPQVVSIVLNYNPARTNVILGKQNILLWGKRQLTDKIGNLKFKISPQSFFQINSLQTPRLYQLAIKQAKLTAKDVVVDAYAGIGTIGLTVAKHVKSVRGMEVVPAAVHDANANAKLNHIVNAKYVVGEAEKIMPNWAKKGLKTDVIFVDPPRKGLSTAFIRAAVQTQPQKLAYISCNPATLIRDLVLFKQEGYQFTTITPVDMFPQTPQIEAVVILHRNNKSS